MFCASPKHVPTSPKHELRVVLLVGHASGMAMATLLAYAAGSGHMHV